MRLPKVMTCSAGLSSPVWVLRVRRVVMPKSSRRPILSLMLPARKAPAAAATVASSLSLPLLARPRMSQESLSLSLIGSLDTRLTRGLSRLPSTSTPAPTGEYLRVARRLRLGEAMGPTKEMWPLLMTRSWP